MEVKKLDVVELEDLFQGFWAIVLFRGKISTELVAPIEDGSDVATVHDCFTIAEIMAYEDLGFCEKGEGANMVREGETEVGGRIPVNVDGGLKAKGHPIGTTGVSMLAELTKQLREEVKPSRQAPMTNYIALAHNTGGTGHYGYVTILRR